MTIYKLTDADKVAGQTVKQTLLNKIARTNRAALLTAIYGDRPPEGLSGHDHQKAGGNALNRPIFSVSFGKASNSNSYNFSGISLMPPNGSADFTSYPKRLQTFLAVIPGGTAEFKVNVGCKLYLVGGAKTVTLDISIRPLTQQNYKHGYGAAVTESAVFSSSAVAPQVFAEYTFDWQNQSVFNPAIDNLVEVVFWLKSNLTATHWYFLQTACGYVTSLLPDIEQFRFYPGRTIHQIGVGEISNGKPITAQLTDKMKTVCNQTIYACLGRCYGLQNDLNTTEPTTPWAAAPEEHQHRGKMLPMPDGTIRHDGAIPIRNLAIGCYAKYPEYGATGEMDRTPILGHELWDVSEPDANSQTTFCLPVSISAGMRGLRLLLQIQTNHMKHYAECKVYLKVVEREAFPDYKEETNLIQSIRSGLYRDEELEVPADYDYFMPVKVDPSNQDGFHPINAHHQGDLKSWTIDALLTANSRPVGFDGNYPTRTTKPIDIILGSPAIVSTETRHETNQYFLLVRVELMENNYGAAATQTLTPKLQSALVTSLPDQ